MRCRNRASRVDARHNRMRRTKEEARVAQRSGTAGSLTNRARDLEVPNARIVCLFTFVFTSGVGDREKIGGAARI
jgi:hypothetical protein